MDTDGFWYKFCLFYVDENVVCAQILSLPTHPTTPPTLFLSSHTRQNKICHDSV